MERPESENGSCRKGMAKNKEILPCAPRRTLALPTAVKPPAANEVKLAALAIDLNVRLRSADMHPSIQERAIRQARALLDETNPDENRPSPTHLAMRLKKEFDASYGPAWQCIVGKSFGSFVTHSSGGFVYFSVDKLSFLLFKTEVRPVIKAPLQLPSIKHIHNHGERPCFLRRKLRLPYFQ
ncbi:uncharacterized protein LOC110823480 isoform X2 [Carica papaya]|uniref:uncharacterized protein LOC110823480 isoform X2 n=1 Tax=Carica papaya TaxID=3649 RepID=UPI000B8D03A8|nr:uncharacterized protein LOC110823480 isoform X2 [Carica papaya]